MLTPQLIRLLEQKFDATRGWFGWSDWDNLSSALRGALNSEAQWQNCELAGGVLTPYREGRFTHIYVDSEQSLPNGNLSMIAIPSNASNGDLMILRQIDKGRRIEIAHSEFYMSTLGKANFTLDMAVQGYDLTIFMLIDGVWLEIVRHPLPSTTDHISAGLSYEKSDTVIAGATINVDAALMHVTGPLLGGTASMGIIDVTSVTAGNAGPIEVWIQQPAGGGEYSIGLYNQLGSDMETDVEQGLAAAINALTAQTGWSAIYNGGTFVCEVYAPVELGSGANFLILTVANGTLSTISITGMSGGIDGVQQDADIASIAGLATFGTCVIVNHNGSALIRFVNTGTIRCQGGTVLQPRQMATALDQDNTTLVVVHGPEAEARAVSSAELLSIGTALNLIADAPAGYAWEFELTVKYSAGGTPYTTTATYLNIEDQSGNVLNQLPIDLITSASSLLYRMTMYFPILGGKGVYLKTDDATNPTLGNGTWTVDIKKTLHKF